MDLRGRKVSESCVEMTEVVLPNDANPHGTAFGGRIMQWIDIAGTVCAQRHCRNLVVTASMDQLSFLHPIRVGDTVVLLASLNFAGNTSMEVGVKVLSEDPKTGERKHTSTAYLTCVAVDEHGNKVKVPPLLPESEEEKRRYREAEERRKIRLSHKKS